MLVFAELGAGQWNLLNMHTVTREQRERFRVQRKLTHQGVGVQQVNAFPMPMHHSCIDDRAGAIVPHFPRQRKQSRRLR
jgi:hypothetical protein